MRTAAWTLTVGVRRTNSVHDLGTLSRGHRHAVTLLTMHRAPSALTLTVRLPMGGLQVNVAGDLDLSTSEKLVQFTTNQIRPSTAVVTLDLGHLVSCDQEGASALLQILGVCERGGRQLRLVRLQPQVRAVLERTGISGNYPD